MKHLKNSKETDKVYLEMFDIRSIIYTANVNAIFQLLPRVPQL
jgi:hypothetical protein